MNVLLILNISLDIIPLKISSCYIPLDTIVILLFVITFKP